MFRHKAEVLAGHCAAVGRDPAEIVRSQVAWISVEERADEALRWERPYVVAGDVDEVTRELLEFLDAGADHFQIRFMDYPSERGMERFVERVMPRLLERRVTT